MWVAQETMHPALSFIAPMTFRNSFHTNRKSLVKEKLKEEWSERQKKSQKLLQLREFCQLFKSDFLELLWKN